MSLVPGWRWAAAAFAAAVLLLFGYSHLRQIMGHSILFDDAWIGTAAKNLAQGSGYASSYPELIPFDPNITTGPPVVLVAAALIRLVGNQFWVPNLAITLCVLFVFGVFGWLVWRHFGGLAFNLVAALVGLRIIFHSSYEFGLLGEIPAAGMVAIGALLITRGGWPTAMRCLAAGLAVGLAILTKLIMALVLPAFVAMLVAAGVARSRRPLDLPAAEPLWRNLGTFGLGVLLPTMLWNAWVLAAMGSWSGWVEITRSFGGVVTETAELGRFDAGGAIVLGHVAATLTRNSTALIEHAGGIPWALLFSAAIAATALGVLRLRNTAGHLSHELMPSLILGGAAVTHGLWWLLFSPTDWLRYLLPGILYLVIGAALAIGVGIRRSPQAFGLALALLLVSWYPEARSTGWDSGREPRLAALLAAQYALEPLARDDGAMLLGCGYGVAWDLEFLLPRTGNFRDCLRLNAHEVGEKRLILVRNEYFNADNAAVLEAFRAACEQRVLFAREPFVVSECPGLWPLRFPWAMSEPEPVHEDHPFAAIVLPDGTPATFAHASSVLSLAAAGNARSITVRFGLVDGAWQQGETDGAEFRISLVDADGTHLLWSRLVEPRVREADRGPLSATIAVPPSFRGGRVLAETLPGPAGDVRWDWAYWSRLDVQ